MCKKMTCFWTTNAPAFLGDAGPAADPALNEAAFLEDPLDDPRANAALADAALSDPRLGDPAASRQTGGDAKSPRPPRPTPPTSGPPPIRPPASRPATPSSPTRETGQRQKKPATGNPPLQAMSGAAVDEVLAAAAARSDSTLGIADPTTRFRLQNERRNRIKMQLTAVLAVVTMLLAIVLIMVLKAKQAEEEPVAPAAAGNEPAAQNPAKPAGSNTAK